MQAGRWHHAQVLQHLRYEHDGVSAKLPTMKGWSRLTTRNTVLLAMALFGATARTPIYAAASLVGFLAAGLLFGQLGNIFGQSAEVFVTPRAILTNQAISADGGCSLPFLSRFLSSFSQR